MTNNKWNSSYSNRNTQTLDDRSHSAFSLHNNSCSFVVCSRSPEETHIDDANGDSCAFGLQRLTENSECLLVLHTIEWTILYCAFFFQCVDVDGMFTLLSCSVTDPARNVTTACMDATTNSNNNEICIKWIVVETVIVSAVPYGVFNPLVVVQFRERNQYDCFVIKGVHFNCTKKIQN